jgi:hypothetical protein
VARDAAARLYDVDHDSVVFKKLQQTERYDQGTVTFRARKGKLIDLDKLHESIWATRLSGGTRSGLVSLDVVAIGRVETNQDGTSLNVEGSDDVFVLVADADQDKAAVFQRLQKEAAAKTVRVTGRIADYSGHWPDVLRKPPSEPRRIIVAHYEIVE